MKRCNAPSARPEERGGGTCFSSFAVSSCDSSSGFRTRRQTSIRYQVQVVTYPFVLSTSFQTWVVLDRDKLACPCLGPWKETTDNFLVYIDSGVIFEEILRLVKGTKNCSIGLTNWHQRNSEETEENSRLWSSKWEFICCPNEYPYSNSSNHTTTFGPGLIVHQQYKKYFLMK